MIDILNQINLFVHWDKQMEYIIFSPSSAWIYLLIACLDIMQT